MTETDEKCMALLHAARVGDLKAFALIVEDLRRICVGGWAKPTTQGMNDLFSLLVVATTVAMVHRGPLSNLVATLEGANYAPEGNMGPDHQKAEGLYRKWYDWLRPRGADE